MNFQIRKYYDLDYGSMLGGAASGAMTGGPVGAGIGLLSSLVPQLLNMGAAKRQKEAAQKQQQQADQMFANQLGTAKSGYQMAQNNYNARMAGASNLEKNIYQNQANTIGALGRNSTDASQLLQLAGAVQGNTNNAFGNLGTQEAMDKERKFGDLQYANYDLQNTYGQQGMMKQGLASQLGAASQINSTNAMNGIANTGMMAGMGAFNGLGSLFQSNPYTPLTRSDISSVNAPQMGGVTPGYQPNVNMILPYHNQFVLPNP